MPNRSAEDLDRLERSLVAIHCARAVPSLQTEWTQRVMQDVRREAGTAAGRRVAWVERYVWRTAAVATAFALVFAGSLFFSNSVEVEKGELSAFLSEELEAAPTLLE